MDAGLSKLGGGAFSVHPVNDLQAIDDGKIPFVLLDQKYIPASGNCISFWPFNFCFNSLPVFVGGRARRVERFFKCFHNKKRLAPVSELVKRFLGKKYSHYHCGDNK